MSFFIMAGTLYHHGSDLQLGNQLHENLCRIDEWGLRVGADVLVEDALPAHVFDEAVGPMAFFEHVNGLLHRDLFVPNAKDEHVLVFVLMGLIVPVEVFCISYSTKKTAIHFAARCSAPSLLKMHVVFENTPDLATRHVDLLYALAPAIAVYLRHHRAVGSPAGLWRSPKVPRVPDGIMQAALAVPFPGGNANASIHQALVRARGALLTLGYHVPNLSYVTCSDGVTLEDFLQTASTVFQRGAQTVDAMNAMCEALLQDLQRMVADVNARVRALVQEHVQNCLEILAGPMLP